MFYDLLIVKKKKTHLEIQQQYKLVKKDIKYPKHLRSIETIDDQSRY